MGGLLPQRHRPCLSVWYRSLFLLQVRYTDPLFVQLIPKNVVTFSIALIYVTWRKSHTGLSIGPELTTLEMASTAGWFISLYSPSSRSVYISLTSCSLSHFVLPLVDPFALLLVDWLQLDSAPSESALQQYSFVQRCWYRYIKSVSLSSYPPSALLCSPLSVAYL